MKATLQFDLNDLDDRMSHLRCVKSLDMALALWEIRMNLRKYSERTAEAKEFKNEESDVFNGIEIVLERIQEIFEENNIDVEELIN
jgi:hypothetical protein